MDLNHGIYLEEELKGTHSTNLCGCCRYPEKHFEAPNMQTDLTYLRNKVDAGLIYCNTNVF
jgi:methylenetetrahydrofolate reductase (NADPH)